MPFKGKWSPDTCLMTDTVFKNWGQFYLGKRMNKIEYEGEYVPVQEFK